MLTSVQFGKCEFHNTLDWVQWKSLNKFGLCHKSCAPPEEEGREGEVVSKTIAQKTHTPQYINSWKSDYTLFKIYNCSEYTHSTIYYFFEVTLHLYNYIIYIWSEYIHSKIFIAIVHSLKIVLLVKIHSIPNDLKYLIYDVCIWMVQRSYKGKFHFCRGIVGKNVWWD